MNYYTNQINEVIKTQDRTYKPKIKVCGTNAETRFLDVTIAQLEQIKKIFEEMV